ncbi:MAG: hypothetical protein K2X47_09375 [Bdellovibrionales bacterium]|nr:hypothetical protein [Bdellovibrionales bacterium]
MRLCALSIVGILFVTALGSVSAQAQTESQTSEPVGYIRRITLFPLKGISGSVSEMLWWKIRERLTEDRRFLIATRNFMNQKNVFQSRGELSASDVILLSKLLGSHALITAEVNDQKIRTVHVRVYSGVDGLLVWELSSQLDPSRSLENQIEGACLKMIDQMLKDFRFDGSMIVDPIVGSPIYQEGDVHLAKIDIGTKVTPQVGQKVLWIQLERKTIEPLFQGGATESVLAEGEVYDVNREILTVRILRKKAQAILAEKSLVRLIKENDQAFILEDSSKSVAIEPGWISGRNGEAAEQPSEKKPLVTALSILSGIVAFLLLAF